ncbi:bifunctional hydroxymethylpyrimidine kinase/phosphomethylpyrimidine kinase [Proteinivorax hydrogeniformans]|uniref:Hydroxymethylpyrimidine/phosphomethylpyrimidine kinase n=1 Tax=Proteinivorax hydrogeniformans TaxID=1826727 RepID=A0AAU8HVU8_9FIRM
MKNLCKALTIAGSDSGGGAGIQADLKTFQAFDVYGMSAITAVTAQNTVGVRSVMDISPKLIYDQIEMVSKDIGVDACKIGMLSNAEIINAVCKALKATSLKRVVLDPVMVAKSGDFLLKKGDEKHLVKNLLPLCYLITPNIPEAELIAGISIQTNEDMMQAIFKMRDMGAKNILLKGGHMPGNNLTDILFDGENFHRFSSQRVDSKNTHGTGCTLSAAIAASLAKGENLYHAVKLGRNFVLSAIKEAPVNIGKGHGPMYHNIKVSY